MKLCGVPALALSIVMLGSGWGVPSAGGKNAGCDAHRTAADAHAQHTVTPPTGPTVTPDTSGAHCPACPGMSCPASSLCGNTAMRRTDQPADRLWGITFAVVAPPSPTVPSSFHRTPPTPPPLV